MKDEPPICDLCFGCDLAPFRDASACGRVLLRCRGCGLVVAHGPSGGSPDVPDRGRADLRRAAAVMRLIPSGRVLDLDCGEGRFLAALDPTRYEVAGLEADPDTAVRAAERIAHAGQRGTVVQGWLPRPEFAPESFDLIGLFGVLPRAGSPRATLMEVSRLLRTGGYALIEVPSLSSMTARLLGSRWRPLRDPGSSYFFSPASLERMATSCGFVPGAPRLAVPVGWPSPGTLVYAARKSAVAARRPGLSALSGHAVSNVSPLGASN